MVLARPELQQHLLILPSLYERIVSEKYFIPDRHSRVSFVLCGNPSLRGSVVVRIQSSQSWFGLGHRMNLMNDIYLEVTNSILPVPNEPLLVIHRPLQYVSAK